MADQVTLTIDGVAVTVPKGTLVVEAAKRAGNEIPVFCYHAKLESVGMCRMCLVEVGTPVVNRETGKPEMDRDGQPVIRFMPKPVTACTTPVSEGMVVKVNSEAALADRKAVLEFLLTSHPLDCPVCDKGGECPLQDLTIRHGPGMSRFDYEDKQHFPKKYPLGNLIVLDMERCIICARCTRFQEEIAHDPVLAIEERARYAHIVTYSNPPFDSHYSGNTTDICPVGALTSRDFRFKARPWELTNVPGICNHECIKKCPVNEKGKDLKNPILAIKVKDQVTQKAFILENRCLHDRCGICINACPIQAITTINIPFETDDEPPVHKFPDSLFALYRMPHLSQTRILGLLGRNAIGKSTLLEILAGNIRPNGGKQDGHKEWFDNLTVPGLKKHFLDVYTNPDIVAHKKQNLRYMLDYQPIKVGDVLTLTCLGKNGRGLEELEFFKEYLELAGIWEKPPNVLSGGELQRFAIAHTFLTNAHLYLVDEPCTFLDIKQRLKLRRIFEDRVQEEKKSAKALGKLGCR